MTAIKNPYAGPVPQCVSRLFCRKSQSESNLDYAKARGNYCIKKLTYDIMKKCYPKFRGVARI